VIGIMAIGMAGGVYCPLSPGDPQQRLHALVEQTQCHLVLVHWMTRDMFASDIVTVDIDIVVEVDDLKCHIYPDRLSKVDVAAESIAYVIFTSGSTGTPKAVKFRATNNDVILLMGYLF
jgi:arthrofactin-type cyclic lipopeptide synthetase A